MRFLDLGTQAHERGLIRLWIGDPPTAEGFLCVPSKAQAAFALIRGAATATARAFADSLNLIICRAKWSLQYLSGQVQGFGLLSEQPMRARPCEGNSERCAYCGAPLPLNGEGVEAWRVGDQFVCNEFCADGIPPKSLDGAAARPAQDRWREFPRPDNACSNCRRTINQITLASFAKSPKGASIIDTQGGAEPVGRHKPRGHKLDEWGSASYNAGPSASTADKIHPHQYSADYQPPGTRKEQRGDRWDHRRHSGDLAGHLFQARG
jgi:hypothetical protein